MEGRSRFCETLALSFASMATETDLDTMKRFFQAVVDREEDVFSVGLRKTDGPLLFEVGEHSSHWIAAQDSASTDTQIMVPVKAGAQPWGTIEVRFQKPKSSLGGDYLPHELVLVSFIGLTLLVGYHWYLRRVLRQLNPSKVIPSRVRDALNSLAEGILVLNAQEEVVLANHAFQVASGKTADDLMGRRASELPFQKRGASANVLFPWQQTQKQMEPVRGKLLGYGEGDTTFSVSSAPILNDQGESRGVLASFEDVTLLEKKKNELGELVKHLHQSSAEIQRQNRELEQLANHDPLTNCRNRRSFFELFESLWATANRYEMPLSAIMVDIDHFKSINDDFGHSVGDEVLQKVASTLQSSLREPDVLCRYGGEEFAILLPQTDLDRAVLVGEKLRAAVARIQIPNLKLTASFGVSALSESPKDPQDMLDQADQCLYAAKRMGRNRVMRWDSLSTDMQDKSEIVERTQPTDATDEDRDVPTLANATIPFHAVSALVSALAYRDQLTAAHSRRVADLCVAVAEGLLSLRDSYALEMAALLHDIGKIGVPDAILLKPSALNEEERRVMMTHTRIGCEIVQSSFAHPTLTALVRGGATKI